MNLATYPQLSGVVLSIRARLRLNVPLARLATPAVLVAAGLSLGPAQGPSARSARIVADAHPYSGPRVMQPFAATPHSYPLAGTTLASSGPASSVIPVAAKASVPAVALPTGLAVPPAAAAIPLTALAAYVNAAQTTDRWEPACKVSWQMLAGIGLVESDNARSGGSANPDWDGVAAPPIYGPLLNGRNGTAQVPDTDHGRYDGNSTWDRAVGPMQMLPSTWAAFAADGNHDGIRNPQDIDDAALAASDYLCTASPALNRPHNLVRALYSYNHSFTYVRTVLTAIAGYLSVNPAKLGINGLPQPHRPPPFQIVLPGAPPAASPSPPTAPAPKYPWVPKPTPTAPPKPPLLPKR